MMPKAFASGGIWFALVATPCIGLLYLHCLHTLVKCSRIVCVRKHISSVHLGGLIEAAMYTRPTDPHRTATVTHCLIDSFVCIDLLACCAVFVYFAAINIKDVLEMNLLIEWALVWYMLLLFPLLSLIIIFKKLMALVPFSAIANVLTLTTLGIVLYFVLFQEEWPQIDEKPAIVSNWEQQLTYFALVTFAFHNVVIVFALENNVAKPQHFIGCPSVLSVTMSATIVLVTLFGFIGAWKYGHDIQDNVLMDLPVEHK